MEVSVIMKAKDPKKHSVRFERLEASEVKQGDIYIASGVLEALGNPKVVAVTFATVEGV